MKRLLLILLLTAAVFPSLLSATGPSHMEIRINPVSVNQRGDVLSKSASYLNSQGAHMQVPLNYRWVVISAEGEISEYEWHFIDTRSDRDWTEIQAELNHWEELYNDPVDFASPSAVLDPILRHYGFREENAESYKVGKSFTYQQLRRNYGIRSAEQSTLDKHVSDGLFDSIHVSYAFPGFLLLRSSRSFREQEGAEFDFYYSYRDQELDYALYSIDAVIKRGGIICGSSMERLESCILEQYDLGELNPAHKEDYNSIYQDFLDLLLGYHDYSRDNLDERAIQVFDHFYRLVGLGMLEDAPDSRRQAFRAALCFSSLALCSSYNYSYYLEQALIHLQEYGTDSSRGGRLQPIDLLEHQYAAQFLVNLYISNLKDSEAGVREALEGFFFYYDSLKASDSVIESMKRIVEEISAAIPESRK